MSSTSDLIYTDDSESLNPELRTGDSKFGITLGLQLCCADSESDPVRENCS
jgi:hypothetical protein